MVGQSPSTERRRFKARVPAPLFELEKTEAPETLGPASPIEDVSQLLAKLLQQNASNQLPPSSRTAWNPRKALVCTSEDYREAIARHLTKNGYQVFVAQETSQAIDRMREDQLEVVLLDQDFDAAEQGAAFVTREVNVLRPAQRRRVFFVLLSQVQRTMDAHAAFLHNVNAIVNFKEIDDLFGILEHALRDYNELYKEFNQALKLAAL
jgi:CheY-like chemotaxis protein